MTQGVTTFTEMTELENNDYVYLEFVMFRRVLMPGLRRPSEMFDNFVRFRAFVRPRTPRSRWRLNTGLGRSTVAERG